MAIQLTQSQVEVFGRPNFSCARISHVLIKAGVYEKGEYKAEYEQAVYIHWASNLLENHGENWKQVGNETIKKLLVKLEENEKSEGGK